MEIENKIVLITGGANGIGLACAKELLRNGAGNVAILDLRNSGGQITAKELNNEYGKGKVIFNVCDVTKPKELEDGFARTVNEFGGLDIVINNAGIMDDSRWELMININVIGVIRGTLLGFQYMGKNNQGKKGVIVNLASIVGVAPAQTFPIYTATKHAVVGLSRSFGTPAHLEKTGVRVLTICPSLTNTDLLNKLPEKMLDSGEVARKQLERDISKYPSQSVENVALGVTAIIKSAPNGSVWISENGEPAYQILIPLYPELKI